jgi:hypothetical protein
MSNPIRSLRLSSSNNASLSASTHQNGEVFYDSTEKTLTLFDGRTRGGIQLLRADLANASGSLGVSVGATPPTNAQQGSQWVNSQTGVLYIFYVDANGGHWIQPIATAVGSVPEPVELFTASVDQLGVLRVDGTSVVIDQDGVISAVSSTSFNDSDFIGVTTTQFSASILNSIFGATGTVVHDISSSGTVFYHSNVISNFIANFTNVPSTDNRSTTVSLVISQNNPAHIANSIQINGQPQTINWENSLVPTGNIGNTDIITFTLIRTSNTWLVTGSLSTHGEI